MDTTLTPERITQSTQRGYWRNESLETYLDRWATRRPRKIAIVDALGRHTYAELAALVERVAHGLSAHGVEPGGVISCQLPNWNETIVLFLAAARLGAIVNPIPPTYRASELRFMLGLLESQVMVIPEVFRGFSYTEMLAGLRRELPRVEHVFVVRVAPGPGRTALFVRPGHAFRTIDALVTNFHLPRSTLLMLVCAFGGTERVLAAYREAVSMHYRFFSYGDAMAVFR